MNFKINDQVRVTVDWSGWLGKVGLITEITPGWFLVDVPNGPCWFSSGELAPASHQEES